MAKKIKATAEDQPVDVVSSAGLPEIAIDQIIPSPLNPRKEFDEAELMELADSIKKIGLIQAVTVRKTVTPDGMGYELICGERRWRACKLAGLNFIPASIRQLSDQEAMEMMVTENLQRKDVHPFEEANAFLYMKTFMTYENADIAAKVGKNEPFVVRRLQLLNLVPDLQGIFKSNQLSIGHAELLSRVDAADQKAWYENKFLYKWGDGQGTIKDLRQYLRTNTENKLSKAKFRIADPYQGDGIISETCTECKLNSACNQVLFPDGDDEATCNGSKCFSIKTSIQFDLDLNYALASSMPIVRSSYGGADEIIKKLKDDGIEVLKENLFDEVKPPFLNQYHGETDEAFAERSNAVTSTYEEKKTNSIAAFCVYDGKFINIILKNKTPLSTSTGASRIAFIADIDQKKKRGLELDAEKVMAKIVEHIKTLQVAKQVTTGELTKHEEDCLIALAYENCGYGDTVDKALGMQRHGSYGNGPKYLKAISEASAEVRALIVRVALVNKFNAITPTQMSGGVMFHIAKDWCPDELAAFEADQKTIREKREARLDAKVKEFDRQQEGRE